MSKQNKVNKTNYVQGGRLTPDDMARERPAIALRASSRQGERERAMSRKATERVKAKGAEPAATRRRTAREE